jgi:hypothetical protein
MESSTTDEDEDEENEKHLHNLKVNLICDSGYVMTHVFFILVQSQ